MTVPYASTPPIGVSLEQALTDWSGLLGAGGVLREPATNRHYAATTLPEAPMPSAVLKPETGEEVAELVKIAQRHGVPLYPISRGRNWGYSDARPVAPGQVIVDLAGMNRIYDYDETLACVTIEPGVSQGQLSAYLQERGDRLWMDCTGAGPEASVVGNVLERGFGHSPYGNRVQQVASLEVVLADGNSLHTGFGHYQGAQTGRIFPNGLGPSLDGLFAQSNFGIVTRMTIWLLPRPERLQLILLSSEDPEDLPEIVEALRRLRLGGTIRSVAHVGNDLRVLSSITRRARLDAPWDAPLTADVRRALRSRHGIGAWTLSAGLYGTAAEVAASKRIVARALRGSSRRLLFLDRGRLALAKCALAGLRFAGFGAGLAQKLEAADAILALNSGRPSDHFLAGAYWRNRRPSCGEQPSRTDPAADGCGIMWLAPVLPMTGRAAKELLGLVEPDFVRFGFDPLITLSAVNERALAAVLTIAFDRDDVDETARARDCHDALLYSLFAAGFPPYRVGLQAMPRLGQGSEGFWPTVRTLKQALDPNGIVAPGRYDGSSGGTPG